MGSILFDRFNSFVSGLSLPDLATFIFAGLIIILCLFIIIYQRQLRNREANTGRWDFIADHMIRSAIFFEEDEPVEPAKVFEQIISTQKFAVPDRLQKLLKNSHFRKLLSGKLVAAKRNMTGGASDNLSQLYKQLDLDKRAIEMLDSSSWYLKALSLQQLGIMGLQEYEEKIFGYVNHKRGLIRVEAQNAILKFQGFGGLRFLDTASYPITEWQQIKLLDELSQLPNEHFTGIDVWLSSTNDTVILFALKLVKTYHRFELYDQVKECLKHTNPEVRRQAIWVLKELPNHETASDLITVYPAENTRNQITILHVLESVSTGSEIPFLSGLLDDESDEIKFNTVRTLASLGTEGMEVVMQHPMSDKFPLNQIIAQIKEELR
ncbi:HEAT repeat-containing protein [Daejeonella rubra]|uniref:HEAT repeat-containing protein n=1 Tax=Daejeonella rubra TaxID=990371 RepID=A0A1G9UYM7_9SPHI|nr:HEAT repeat domain-containing protein [Daejeonella rubra]SDM64867.1 HEAT repeat-containing protein [Daejeonella rubra]